MATKTTNPIIQTKPVEQTETVTKQPPLYNVILHDDDDHSYNYVIMMLMKIFGKTQEQAYKHAEDVHKNKRSIVDTTSLERAELKQEQIHSYGKDPYIPHCAGSMTATIEPAT